MKFSLPALLLALAITFSTSLFGQQTIGLFQNDATAYNGYTLWTPMAHNGAFLIDNCGREVHRWPSTNNPGLSEYLLESGHLLRTQLEIGYGFQSGGKGGRVEKVAWDGTVLWQYAYVSPAHHQHHDIAPLPNGNILILAWEKKGSADAIDAGRDPGSLSAGELWPEHVVELQPIGADSAVIVWEWHLWDHLVQDIDISKSNYGVVSDHPEFLDINATPGFGGPSAAADFIHANSIDYNPVLDQVMISSRTMSEFWIIDHSTSTTEAASHSGGNSGKGGDILYRWGNPSVYQRGVATDQVFFGQHDAHWIKEGLPNAGKIMVFNNGAGRPDGPRSSIDILDPPLDSSGNYSISTGQAFGPDSLYWTYYPPLGDFFSSFIAGARQLPGGNILICEGAKGRFFEIDSLANTVWEYVNPVDMNGPMTQGTNSVGNTVFRCTRYGPNYPGFWGKDLSPGNPIEINPLPDSCSIFVPSQEAGNEEVRLSVYPNPFTDWLGIKHEGQRSIRMELMDLHGRVLHTFEAHPGSNRIELPWLPHGVYLLKTGADSFLKLIH